MKKLFLLCIVLSCGLFGCGSGDVSSGSLSLSDITLSDLTGGTYEVEATATYTPDAGKDPTGAVIKFTAQYTTPSNPEPFTKTKTEVLSNTGVATYLDMITQGSEPVYLRLTASTGGLSKTKIISIPAIVTP
ncbi:MAG: hypothetical protein PHH28_02185 [Desulfuromonadaceae bacterium]|nr:hypothetical protein [Desulfuromonadaceae bacterium]